MNVSVNLYERTQLTRFFFKFNRQNACVEDGSVFIFFILFDITTVTTKLCFPKYLHNLNMIQENTILMEEICMEYREKSEVADVAIDGPPKKLKVQIQRTVEPKVKRKRGRPRKKVIPHFAKNCVNGKPKKLKDLPPLEPWTFTRLRQNGREEKLEKMRRNAMDMLKVTAMVQRERMRKWREKQKDRRCTDGTSIEPVKTVWFVKMKEEQYMDVTSHEESDMCAKIEIDDRFKIENPEAENQQINGVVSYTGRDLIYRKVAPCCLKPNFSYSLFRTLCPSSMESKTTGC